MSASENATNPSTEEGYAAPFDSVHEDDYDDDGTQPRGSGPSDYRRAVSEASLGWEYHDEVHVHKRTTSMHRNLAGDVDRPGRLKDLEDRRQWTTQAATLRRQRFNPDQYHVVIDQHAKRIVAYMQQDNTLNDEQARKEALRDMPQSLVVKKRVKRYFTSSVTAEDSNAVGCLTVLKYRLAMSLAQLKGNVKDFLYTFELWYDALKRIEGNFGSGVSSYFKFLRWLFIINLLTAAMFFCFICVPQIVIGHRTDGGNVDNSSDSIVNASDVKYKNYYNRSEFNVSDGKEGESSVGFRFVDIFTGSGYLDNTLLYYGYYSSDNPPDAFSIPQSYFLTAACVYVAVFAILSYTMARSYRKSFIETKSNRQNAFAHKIFCGWDFSVATPKAAKLKSNAIYNELKELLSDADESGRYTPLADALRTFAMRFAAHAFSVAVVASCGWLMYVLLKEVEGHEVLPAVVINLVMIFVPLVFRLLASYEDYKNPKTAMFVTLTRTVLLEVAVVGVLIYYWLFEDQTDCWENKLGQEIYRLIMFDFFFSTLLMSLFDVLWYFAHLGDKSKIKAPQFDIATNTLSVIYNQTLFFLGMYFSPLLGVAVVVKMFLMWYVRSFVLMRCCEPPSKSWRAAQNETAFLIITFLWCLFLLFVHGYHILQVDSSEQCGPLRKPIQNIFNVDSGVIDVLSYVMKPGVVAVILIGMAMGVYYLRSVSKAQIETVHFLRDRLVLAAKDKEFLIDYLNKVANGPFRYNNKERDEIIDPRKLPPAVEPHLSGQATTSGEI